MRARVGSCFRITNLTLTLKPDPDPDSDPDPDPDPDPEREQYTSMNIVLNLLHSFRSRFLRRHIQA